MDAPKPSQVRVLMRPPPPPSPPTASSSSSLPPPPPLPTSIPSSGHSSSSSSATPSPSSSTSSSSASPSLPLSSDGVVVVGFISRRPDDSIQLINRVIDFNVFGSGNLDKPLFLDEEEAGDWFKRRRISYYHDEEKGILYLQFCSTRCPAIDGFSEPSPGFDSVEEEHEYGDLQGMLFMFSVCHVIIYIQEGSHFGTKILSNFRLLQTAKHAMAPLVRSQTANTPSRSYSSSFSRSTSSSKNSSPGRGGAISSRNASAISLMSVPGSYTLFPGQCIPVTLFVSIDEFSNLSNTNSNGEDSSDSSSLNHSSNLSGVAKTNVPAKGSGSVVVLARPASRSEGGSRRKLQSSLEAQIRGLIKKCRTLSGSESSYSGIRTGGSSTSAPLFSLDASKAVVLLDQSSNRRGESLEFATGLVEDVLNGKINSDSLLLESHSQSPSKEDIVSVKDFIYRQSDILRGRGGLVNANSGSAAGVGMVAVAAAAAAASASSGKKFATPDLPNFEVWLSLSHHILSIILCSKGSCLDEFDYIKRRPPRPRSTVLPTSDGSSKVSDPLDVAASWLHSGEVLIAKFSTSWCQRAIPAAKEIYLKDLPDCYPTSQHETHLNNALNAFYSMVKGPAVQLFAKKLEQECTLIWESGRQLCDAVSLTSKPCMHPRHDVETGSSDLGDSLKAHSSGYFFLHACACGRSRQLHPDPFDFESADASCFSDCDKLLPSLKLPEIEVTEPIQLSSWSLLRIGDSRYYEPSKGLLQSGFCATRKFLLKWTIYLEKQKMRNGSAESLINQGPTIRPPMAEFIPDAKKTDVIQSYPAIQNEVGDQRTSLDNMKSDDKKISFGRGLPNFKMRKPFSEVVAGSAAGDSGFPPLQQRKLPTSGSDKGMKQTRTNSQSLGHVNAAVDHQVSQKSLDISLVQGPLDSNSANNCREGDPLLQIGSNAVPVYLNDSERIKSHSFLKHVKVYVGFEHECPHGHRFLLNTEHLAELGSSYSLSEEYHITSVEPGHSNLTDHSRVNNNTHCGKVRRSSVSENKERDVDKSSETIANGDSNSNGVIYASHPQKDQNLTSVNVLAKPSDLPKDLGEDREAMSTNDGDHAFSMLNRNLPVYMSCPHCKVSRNKKDPPKVKFASPISQLKRIFLVTPSFPVTLATCPIVQFETSCLPQSVPDREQKLQFGLGCQVVLPPQSFLTLKLPFVYGVQLEGGRKHPLNPFEQQPEMTAWIVKGSMLQILSKGNNDEDYQKH